MDRKKECVKGGVTDIGEEEDEDEELSEGSSDVGDSEIEEIGDREIEDHEIVDVSLDELGEMQDRSVKGIWVIFNLYPITTL